MLEDIKTLLWFLKKPTFYATMISLIYRKFFLPNKDAPEDRQVEWCEERKTSLEDF